MSIGIIRNLGGGSESFVPFEQEFAYSGTVEELTINANGVYKLETWGAEGGNSVAGNYKGGKGGYSFRYVFLTKGTSLFVCVGQKGEDATSTSNGKTNDAYNGGGHGHTGENRNYRGGAGGGATHIALVPNVLSTIGYENFVTNKLGKIVAGGGGGGCTNGHEGGDGGGLVGLQGGEINSQSGTGGTQTAGGTSGITGGTYGSFGQGGYYDRANEIGGGGGGLFGGGYGRSAAGGSGYIEETTFTHKGVVYQNGTQAGVNEGNGKAKVTRVA